MTRLDELVIQRARYRTDREHVFGFGLPVVSRCDAVTVYLIIRPIEHLEFDTTLERISSTDILEFVLVLPYTRCD